MSIQEASAPRPDKAQVEAAIATGETLEKVQRQRPRWEDYVSEGVIDRVPEPGPDGECRVQVSGHGNVVRMLQMNEQANNLAAWHGDNRAESRPRRTRREERAEMKARKSHVPAIRTVIGQGLSGTQYRCERGHTFRFLTLPMSEREPTHPCVRDGCNGVGRLERA